MRRPIAPVSEYFEHERYPAIDRGPDPEWTPDGEIDGSKCVVDETGMAAGVSRRGFWGRLALFSAAGAGVGAGVSLLPDTAAAGPDTRDRRKKVAIHLGGAPIGKQTRLSAQSVVVFTGDEGLATWLRRRSGLGSLLGALRRILLKAKDGTLSHGKKLYHLERMLGAEIRRRYRARTGKSARKPDVMLLVGRRYRIRRMLGGVSAPVLRRRRTTP